MHAAMTGMEFKVSGFTGITSLSSLSSDNSWDFAIHTNHHSAMFTIMFSEYVINRYTSQVQNSFTRNGCQTVEDMKNETTQLWI